MYGFVELEHTHPDGPIILNANIPLRIHEFRAPRRQRLRRMAPALAAGASLMDAPRFVRVRVTPLPLFDGDATVAHQIALIVIYKVDYRPIAQRLHGLAWGGGLRGWCR